MKVSDQIISQEQKLARLERNLARQKLKQRKADTRNKIQLGGLIIKAGLDKYSKDIILGALTDAVEQLIADPDVSTVFKAKGQAAFMGFDEFQK